MLSILIPVYKTDVVTLVNQLYQQLDSLKITFEILVWDDGSGEPWTTVNKNIERLPNTKYHRSPANQGRAITRNLLAQSARHQYLLFLDADVALIRDDFISTYLLNLQNDPSQKVFSGSCIYPSNSPSNPKELLHWKYGVVVENPGIKKRKAHPYSHFHTVNFLVPRIVYLEHPMESSLKKYGHEDSLWAMQLKHFHIPIIPLDNPVLHKGLHPNKVFLRHQVAAVRNLLQINRRGIFLAGNLQKCIVWIQKLKIQKPLLFLYKKSERRTIQNLQGNDPNLSNLSWFKIGIALRFLDKES